ncbi:hypothetical protein NUU61_007225 [Penicillium alfredii]|uniref:Uncharacterized protein n=1 Tax=Penicillium alfredii TaxID=1506179 RepID=A0A9W9K4C7_9EURO|nr:uncharacterized protein NUU61_007225 [Penicillium alfredii]KAJ5092355.1 hypothetical protein NUU61_007225 [Penicillium alfredii]
MAPSPASHGTSDSPSLPPPEKGAPPLKDKKPPDPNMANPRLLVNRACIYERRLPGDAYITVHVQRLQHGFYSSAAVSDKDAEHVDFLALGFTFHSPHTLTHRFKAATIRATVHGTREVSTSAHYPQGYPPGNPRFLMHAPHLIYGTVSPETMEWTFSLAGSLGISEMPVSASVIPSGSVNGRYRRYEMMRIQGSARTRKSPRGREFDVEAGEVVWSLEENSLQQSGLPREFTFVMLIQKPSPTAKISLSLDIDPVVSAWFGTYPRWLLSLPSYQPAERRGIDFRQEMGQRFGPVDEKRGFNFAALESSLDDYIAMPGRKYSRSIQLPPEDPMPSNLNEPYRRGYPGQYGTLDPLQQMQNHSLSLQNNLLQTQLQQIQPMPRAQPSSQSTSATAVGTSAQATDGSNTLNIRLLLDTSAASYLSTLRAKSPRADSPVTVRRSEQLRRTRSREFLRERMVNGVGSETDPRASPRSSKLHEIKDNEDDVPPVPGGYQRVMMMANRPISAALLATMTKPNGAMH